MEPEIIEVTDQMNGILYITNALQHLLGEPQVNLSTKNSFDVSWEIKNETLKDYYTEAVIKIYCLLDCFEVKENTARCDIAKWNDLPKPDHEYLRISFKHPWY